MVLFQGQPEPYFEFDALITAVQRAYDSCGFLLWTYFGGKGKSPDSFEKILPRAAFLPQQLLTRLRESKPTYKKVAQYRNCIQHCAPVDFGIASVPLQRLDNGAWSLRVRIPDNPLAGERGKFLYSQNYDALTYGWHVGSEILDVATAVMVAIDVQEKIKVTQ